MRREARFIVDDSELMTDTAAPPTETADPPAAAAAAPPAAAAAPPATAPAPPATAPAAPVAEAGSRPRHSKSRRVLWVLAALVVIVLLWLVIKWLVTPAPKPAPPPTVNVGAARVTRADVHVYLDELGTVTPVYTVTVASRVAGELLEVRYTEGQLVKKDELLAVVDPRPYRALVVQAQGQLARDQAMLKNARIDLVRYQNSYAEHAIPEQQLATQQATVDADEGTVRLDQGNLDSAQVNLDYTRIVSPIDGRVGLRIVDPGNIVPANATTGIATITQLEPITVIFTIAEDNIDAVIAQMAGGRKLGVDAFDRTQKRLISSGTLLTLDNQINVATGTVRARASFANTRNELFPNEFVNARLLVKTLSQAIVIPDAALQRNGDAAFVYVIGADGTVQSHDVKVLASDAGVTAVTGVEPGDQVVTDGFDKLQNGTHVTPQAPAAADKSKGAASSGGARAMPAPNAPN
jgi:multidrug efflux system membrane fusion protein